MEVIEIFKLPQSCIQGIRLTKKELRASENLMKGDEDIIDYYIDSMTIEGIISSDKINIPQYKQGYIYYPYIMVLTVTIKFKEKAQKVANFIQRVIPNHIVLAIKYENQIMFNCTIKELKEDSSGIFITDTLYSPWIDIENPDVEENKFLNCMDIKKQSYDNLYKTYMDFYTKVKHSKLIDIIEFYPDYVFQDGHNYNSEISEIEEISSTIEKLQRYKEKEYNHQSKMECYMKIKAYEKRIEVLMGIIRGKNDGQA